MSSPVRTSSAQFAIAVDRAAPYDSLIRAPVPLRLMRGRCDAGDYGSPDLIIADIGMPEQDGFTLMRRIRRLIGARARTPAIALSAFARPEDRRSAREAGFTQFIAKPATPQDVLRAVQKLLTSV